MRLLARKTLPLLLQQPKNMKRKLLNQNVNSGLSSYESIDQSPALNNLTKNDTISLLVEHFRKEHNFNLSQISEWVSKREYIRFPVSIFKNKKLSGLETLTKYMKENLKLKNIVIARLLHRGPQAIWTTYNNVKEKMPEQLKIPKTGVFIPITAFDNDLYPVLESITKYLKEDLKLNYRTIGELLGRNERTIWTVYQRSIKR